eukprot:TRINITY_DN555_c0_g1_i1.p1 TRINITY_DN555_c0_g1~~TRINITY_DN555_c0_g1_i1.p1  ORF type:complete len:780 (+),score=232.01 TRINITY_DN555_c0_g1_i1:207-2546(+)
MLRYASINPNGRISLPSHQRMYNLPSSTKTSLVETRDLTVTQTRHSSNKFLHKPTWDEKMHTIAKARIKKVEARSRREKEMEEAEKARDKLLKKMTQRLRWEGATEKEIEKATRKLTQLEFQRTVIVPEVCTVKQLADLCQIGAVDVLKYMIRLGERPMSSNEILQPGIGEVIVQEVGHKLGYAEQIDEDIYPRPVQEDRSNLPPKVPVLSVMGHVNHGKTSLLDALRASKIKKVDQEEGKITQRNAAFGVKLPSGGQLTVIDTPGHAAFEAMRKRGAFISDICILVIAADEGVNTQTIEAIKHIKEAKTPLIVAVNKIDKKNANPQKVEQDLAGHEIIVENLGGNIPSVHISATQGTGIPSLLDVVELVMGLGDIRADPTGPGEGLVLESSNLKGFGPTASLICQQGTFKQGDVVLCGTHSFKLRKMIDENGKTIQKIGPGQFMDISGMPDLVFPGELIMGVNDEKKATRAAAFRAKKRDRLKYLARANAAREKMIEEKNEHSIKIKERESKLNYVAKLQAMGAEDPGHHNHRDLQAIKAELEDETRAAEEEEQDVRLKLPVIVKGDSIGAIEAVTDTLKSLPDNEVVVKVMQTSGVGPVSEGDISNAEIYGAMILAYGTPIPNASREKCEKNKIPLAGSNVIYDLLDKFHGHVSTMIEPNDLLEVMAEATIQQIFPLNTKTQTTAAGCKVKHGLLKKSNLVRVVRDNQELYNGKIETLRHFKSDVSEMKAGQECGMVFGKLPPFVELKEGDVIQSFVLKKVPRRLGEEYKGIVKIMY